MRQKRLLYYVVLVGSLSPVLTQGRQMLDEGPGKTPESLLPATTIVIYEEQGWAKTLPLVATTNRQQADDQLISGTITDEKGATLPGVSVLLKESSRGSAGPGSTNRQRGAVTDANGRFQLAVPDGATLVVSLVGYLTQEIAVGNRQTINVQLVPDTKALEEVVVVGYGTQRKVETTGAIASVKAADLLQTPVANVAQGLQARVAGVQITQNSGAPGGNVSVRIRGTNSINGSSEPLYVIDGIQIANTGNITDVSPLSQINPNDIESIDVLKDASSTAIYGARAANGVVLITTKRGKDGATRVSYDGYGGVQQVNKTLNVLDARQFAQLENEVYKRSIYTDPSSLGEGTNWQNLIFRKAPIQSHQLSVTGGNQKTQLALSLNYFNQDGIIKNSSFERYSFRSNIDHRLSDRVKIGTSLYYGYSVNRGVSVGGTGSDVTSSRAGVLGAAVAAPPTLVPYRADGSVYPFQDQMNGQYQEVTNPLNFITPINRQTSQRILANVYVDFALFKGFTYRPSFNVDLGNTLSEFYSPLSLLSQSQLASGGGNASNVTSFGRTLLHESIFTYRTRLAEHHTLAATAVLATQANVNQSYTQTASNFPNDITENNSVGLAVNQRLSSDKNKSRLDSYLGRINYGYKDRYFLDLTARADGSSKFGENNKYGFFPAVAGAWRIVEEPFMKSIPVVSDLKLRGSWGITGNAGAIDPYQSLATVVASGLNYNYNHNPVTGINPNAIPNPDLKWERSTQVDVGLDVSLFNNRLSVVADYYNKRTDNLLFQKVLPMSSGYTFITGNFGSIQNRGVELAINGRILQGSKRGLQWDASANVTFNKNEVLALDGILDELPRSAFALLKIGYPMGLYRTYIFDGISQTGEAVLPGYDGRVGGHKVKDINGDGTITAADQVIVGNSQPKYIFGFSSSFRYRGFDLNLFVQGVQGNKLMNLFRYTFETALGQQNVLAGMANRWSATNPNNEYASGFQGGRLPISDRYVEDASFVRLKNVSLGYTFPKIKGINQIRIYVSANNALTLTNYTGFDPEVNNFGNATTQFVDNGTYPIARSFLGGLQITL
ncbi:SusC/RagA family TonB-linked outer membrane protein [Spirosoma oryzicola]|uniref:SusC/RagA family TonB-linked outer membrane protein n=1 Tax=Spirosoma oryzicola TaxID=2898794 RepID=UPI001E2FBF5F|nr:TonB-dependent receptor [Spirosoma oryzicola]UHG93983.1 TonB-dependent receptor [Spirosoma oryzicola]